MHGIHFIVHLPATHVATVAYLTSVHTMTNSGESVSKTNARKLVNEVNLRKFMTRNRLIDMC